MAGFSAGAKRITVAVLVLFMTVAMTPFYGEGMTHAADGATADKAGKAAKKSDVIKEIKETGIDARSIGIASDEGEADAPAIMTEDGGYAAEDMVPAETAAPDPAKKPSKAGKKLMSMTNFQEFDTLDLSSLAQIAVGAGASNVCEFEGNGETFTYKFVAPKTAAYFFYAQSSYDTCGRVLDSSGNEVAKNDDDGDGNNFKVSFQATAGRTYYLQANMYSDSEGTVNVYVVADEYTASINVKTYKSSGNAYITGKATGDTFYDIYVDGNRVYAGISDKASFAYTLDMKNYDVGFHTISAELKNHDVQAVYKYAVPTYIYSKPSIKRSNFTTGSKYFVFYNSGNSYSKDSSCSVYLDYKKKGGKKWKNNYGPVANYNSGKKSGLKPNTWYYVRAHYGKKVSYNGKTYFFTGKETGKKSGNVKIKTGKKKKPPVKSITITKAKEFSKTYSYTTWIYIGGYGYPTYHTYTQWYTSFKVTVKMKKKPGAKGIYIGNVRCKGNKKKYTADFTVTGKQKGKRLKVAVCTYQSPIFMAYSPSYTKKVKVRK